MDICNAKGLYGNLYDAYFSIISIIYVHAIGIITILCTFG